MNLDELAVGYLNFYNTKKDEDFWAFEEVSAVLSKDVDQAWELIKKLVARCKSDQELAYVAAGPLEDLLKKHGPEVIDRVESEADRNDRMKMALTGVWLGPEYPVHVRFYDLMKKYGFVDGTRAGL